MSKNIDWKHKAMDTASFEKKLAAKEAHLEVIRSLLATGNMLEKLPTLVFSLINITELDLSFNAINELPREIAALKQLRE